MEAELKYKLPPFLPGDPAQGAFAFYHSDSSNKKALPDLSHWPLKHYDEYCERRFCAAYLDDEKGHLKHLGVGFRLRREGETYCLTAKWNVDPTTGQVPDANRTEHNLPLSDKEQTSAALSVRGEWNHTFKDDRNLEQLIKDQCWISILEEMDCAENCPGNLIAILLDLPLVCQFYSDFVRISANLTYRDSCIELAVDQGFLVAGNKREPVSELELELTDGHTRDLLSLAHWLETNAGLVAEPRSKLARLYALAAEQQAQIID